MLRATVVDALKFIEHHGATAYRQGDDLVISGPAKINGLHFPLAFWGQVPIDTTLDTYPGPIVGAVDLNAVKLILGY